MSKQREALEIALEALIEVTGWQWAGPMRVMDEVEDAISAIREALAEPEQEPVAWMCADEDMTRKGYSRFSRNCEGDWSIPVYTAPPARKPLTDDELKELWKEYGYKSAMCMKFARAIERAHGINEGQKPLT